MNVWGVNFHLWRQAICSVLSRMIRQGNYLIFGFSSTSDSQGHHWLPIVTERHSRSQGWMSTVKCAGYRLVISRNDALCHFKRGILGSFQTGNSLIQCHTYILVPMTYYSHLHVGRKQILKNILWSSTHWFAWNLSSVLHLKGRRSRNVIYTILKKKKKRKKEKKKREHSSTSFRIIAV